MYQIWLANDVGRVRRVSNIIDLEWTKVLGDVGWASVRVNNQRSYLPSQRLAIYRQNRLTTVNFVREINRQELNETIIEGPDVNELLARRIVAYYAGSADALITSETADDIMKAVVLSNLEDGADYGGSESGRTINSLTTSADLSAGPTTSKGFAWRGVLNVLQDLQADSKALGTEVYFSMVATTETSYVFKTWIGGTPSGFVFSLRRGNLKSVSLAEDYTKEANFIYAGGKGQESERIIQEASDDTRIGTSGRIEAFAYSNGETSATVLADARKELELRRPKTRMFATLVDSPSTPYGLWDVGSQVTIDYAGRQYSAVVTSVKGRLTQQGQEKLEARAEVVSA